MSIYKIRLDANLQTSNHITFKSVAIYVGVIFAISCLGILLH